MRIDEIIGKPVQEKAQTIASATGKSGMINRKKAKAAVDPHNYFKGEKSAYQNVKEAGK